MISNALILIFILFYKSVCHIKYKLYIKWTLYLWNLFFNIKIDFILNLILKFNIKIDYKIDKYLSYIYDVYFVRLIQIFI